MSLSDIRKKITGAGVKRGDVTLIALLLVLSAAALCFSLSAGGGASQVRICVDGRQTALLPLDTDTVYEVPGTGGNVVEISGGRVRMLHAGCPDKSCVRQGYASRSGECIVCLPARVTVTVLSADSSEGLDAVAY